jgi:hypothetical protein
MKKTTQLVVGLALAWIAMAPAPAAGHPPGAVYGEICGPGDTRDLVCRRSGRVTTQPADAVQEAQVRGKRPQVLAPKTTVRVESIKRQSGTADLAFGPEAHCTVGNTTVPTELMTRWNELLLFKLFTGKTYCKIGRKTKTTEVLCDPNAENCGAEIKARRARASFRASPKDEVQTAQVIDFVDPLSLLPQPYASRIVKVTVCSGYIHVKAERSAPDGSSYSSSEATHESSNPSRVLITVTELFYRRVSDTSVVEYSTIDVDMRDVSGRRECA